MSKGSRLGVGSLIVSQGLPRASKPLSGVPRLFFPFKTRQEQETRHEMSADLNHDSCRPRGSGSELSREQKFDDLFRTMFPMLLFYVRQRGLAEEDSRDIAQDCFVRLWEKKVTLDNPEHCKNLLFRMARHQIIDRWRKQQVSSRFESLHHEANIEESNAEEALIKTEALTWLIELIRDLPDRIRQVCDFYYLQDQDDDTISRLLDRSVHTVRNQRRRGLELLRASQKNLNSDPD